MDVQFLITFQLGNLLMLLGEITCWSFLRVRGLNDHSVFLFFLFLKSGLTKAHAGSLQLIINTSGYPIVNM